MKIPVISYVLIVVGLAAFIFGFFYKSLQPLETMEGKIEKTRMTEMKISHSTRSKNTGTSRSTSLEPVLGISIGKDEFYVREIYKEYWKNLEDKSLIGKTLSVTFEKNSYLIEELNIDGKTIIDNQVSTEGNQPFSYFFYAFGAMAFYMAWNFYNKKKLKSQRT